MRDPVSRRSFLLASAGVVAATAAACKKQDNEIKVSPKDTADSGSLPKDLSLVVASYIHVTGIEQRLSLALIQGTGSYTATGPVDITIDGQPATAEVHREGILLPYFLLRHRFDTTGVHDIEAKVGGRTLKTVVDVTDPAATKVPFPGKPMIRAATPTVADAKGVSPVCTRKPACPLHDVSLDAALDEHRPLAVLFATPALCQSRLCGPVLDNLLAARDEFSAKVRMLHVEIYTDLSGKTITPGVTAYNLESEPFLFLAGADGVVRERLDNAYDKAEVRQALTRLVA
ncbi:MAG: hypothetical protein QOK43_3093 [Acidimicrobiaceae bacterium]|nr:hypothetical protein [Acidimicrobiaceae bacterium]